MKKLSTVLLLSGAIALLFTSCRKVVGEGPVVTQNRNVDNFSAISMSVSGDVYYKQDNVYKVEIQAQQNILDVLETTVRNNELLIKFKNDVRVRSHEKVVVNISAPSVSGLKLSGSGNLTVTGPYTPASSTLNISGSGNITLQNLVTGNLEATISGSGNISVLTGTANSETLRISGSGDIDMQNVVVKTATSSTSGSGETRVNVSQTLHATISGSGSVFYKGNPIITTSISGSGKVIPL